MMEQNYNASIDKVLALLTDPKWIEARSLALGELSAKVKVKKSTGGVTLSMTRRVRRELPALVARVLPEESDLQFEEAWRPDGNGGYAGTQTMEISGQPVRMSAEFSLSPAGKGCTYRIEHHTKCSIPLVGGPIAKFAHAQVEQGCADEFAHLVKYLAKK